MNQTWCLASWSSHSHKQGKPVSKQHYGPCTLLKGRHTAGGTQPRGNG